MNSISQALRLPSERVGTLSNVALPPPAAPPPVIAPDAEDEQRLLRALRDRDEGAFEALLERYDAALLGLASHYVDSRADAEEVVQDTWLAVLDGLDRFAGRSSLKTWIFRILVNRARTRARREARTIPFSRLRPIAEMASPATGFGGGGDPEFALPVGAATAPPWRDPAWRSPTPEEELLAREVHTRVQTAIAELPSRQREVVELRDVEGRSAGEVRGILALSEANQRVLLHRGRAKLRQALHGFVADSPVALSLAADR
jgi:RNA polymerase sigma-70 factor (ECF subfamily)